MSREESPADALLRGERGGRSPRRDRAPAQKATGNARVARVSGAAARADCRDSRKLGGRRKSQLLSRAEEPEEAAGRSMTHLSESEFVDFAEGGLTAGVVRRISTPALRAGVRRRTFERRSRPRPPSTCRSRHRCSGITCRHASGKTSRNSRTCGTPWWRPVSWRSSDARRRRSSWSRFPAVSCRAAWLLCRRPIHRRSPRLWFRLTRSEPSR